MGPCKNQFSGPSLVIYFFATPPIKMNLGRQIGCGLLIANHLDQLLWCFNEKHLWAVSQIIFITLFSAGAHRCWAFDQRPQTVQLCWARTISVRQTDIFWLSFIPFYWAGSHGKHSWRCRPYSGHSESWPIWRCGVGYGNVDLATYSKGNLAKWVWT
jgi:hypothetical protein